jgi:hypothetical protein
MGMRRVDDIDGTVLAEDAEPFIFALDEDDYTIDVTEDKVETLVSDLAKITEKLEEVSYKINGETVTAMVTEATAKKIRDLFDPFIEHGEEYEEPVTAQTTIPMPVKPKKSNAEWLARVRAWAKANGWDVSDRGRISLSIKSAYVQANPQDPEQS